MSRFVDVKLGPRIQGYPVEIAPMWQTKITRVDSGAEAADSRWSDPLREISLPQGVRDQPTFETLKRHWLVMRGPFHTWPFKDATDFASVDLEHINEPPPLTGDDQPMGTYDADGVLAPAVGDGVIVAFQLLKVYTLGSPAEDYFRPIGLPVLADLIVMVDGAPPGDFSPALTYTVTRPGGVVTFSAPLPTGAVPTWGGLFDLNVRFADDETMRGVFRTFGVAGFADLPLLEVPLCED